MKLYCFLLLIILVFLVYDNKLYEGGPGDGAYDPSVRDKTATYKSGELDKEGARGFEFSTIFGGELPFIGEWIPTGDNVDETTCDKFKDTEVCGMDPPANIKHQTLIMNPNPGWSMGDGQDATAGSEKRKCMDCLKCKDNFSFIESFYGNLCDAIAVCGEDDDDMANQKYILSSDPYIYAYNNANWDQCDKDPCPPEATVTAKEEGNCLNPFQKLTCVALNDNTLLDTLLLFGKPASISCSAQIGLQDIAN